MPLQYSSGPQSVFMVQFGSTGGVTATHCSQEMSVLSASLDL
jgi:hypothetical protein